MLIIPVNAVPRQTLTVSLNSQNITLTIYQMNDYGLFMDVVSPQMFSPLFGALCQNCNPVLRDAYFGCYGDFYFNDTQGTEAPYYTGLGSRWFLCYLEPPLLNGLPPS
jgi:hypothetical protein